MSGRTVLVGMSGGVDSAVAAALLVEQGYRVIGATLKIWEGENDPDAAWHERSCCKVGLARFAAEQLRIPYHVFDAREAFEQWVIEDFCHEYAEGKTPNPCVRCNALIKFDHLLRHASDLGADFIATGHYVRIEPEAGGGGFRLKKGLDSGKDQSYFLYRLNQETLGRTLFPLGEMRKERVWEKARALGLPVEELRESQEVCFVNRDGYQEFVAARHPASVRPGNMVTPEGNPLGTHGGIAFYTVGQRRGLGVSTGERRYVVRLNTERNEVVLGSQEDLLKRELVAADVHWIGEDPFHRNAKEVRLSARIRYRSEAADALLSVMGDRSVHVTFQEPQRAVAPGQSVVFYRDDQVLGGGIIL